MSAGHHHLTRPAPVPALHVPRLRFGQHDRITIGGLQYNYAQPTEGGHILNRVDLPGVFQDFSHDAIWMLSNRRDWQVDPDFYSPSSARARSATDAQELSDLAAGEISDVVWKWEFCCRFKELHGSGEYLKTEDGMAAAIHKIFVSMMFLDVAR